VGEVLRVTADNIDTISFNSAWAGYLGSGRINLFRAITDTLPPSVRIDLLSFTSYPGNTFSENDTVSVSLRYTNYLAPVTGLTATISTLNPNVEIIRQTNNIGSLGMLDTASNYLDPFVFRILPGIDFDEQLIFKVTFQGDDYEDYQYFDLIAASSCLILDTNRIATTITAEGKIGYQEFYPLQGIGFIFDDTYSMLSEGGLMIGFSENHVSSCIRGYDDFSVAVKAEKVIPPVFADCEITASYDDEGSAMGASGILINQTAYAWADVQKENFIFMNYQLINNNSLPVDSFFLGFFTDWDIENLYLNIADYDSIHNFSYVFSNDGSNLYTGLKLLSGGSSNHYAFNNVSGGAGGIDIYDIFTIEERYEAMSSTRHHAGPGDVADLLSAGPLYLDTGDTINVAFAIVAAVHMNSLITAMEEAQDLYDSLFVIKEKVFTGNDIVIVSPNPVKAGRYIVVDMGRSVPSQELTSFELVDVSGRISTLQARQKTGTGEMFTIQIPGNLSGVFILRIKSGDKTVNRKLIISD
ncbi:MAG: T9SS type A sorting domain-containing protein, partial [Bacteroidota bacterium]